MAMTPQEVRIQACSLAVKCIEDVQDAARLMALCVFFEAFITRGSAWTQETMKLMPKGAPELRAIKGGKTP